MRSPLAEALAALGGVLKTLRLRWYLFGAQAALLYGASRLTADVDITVQLGDRETASLVHPLERAGFRLRVRDVGGFVARTRVLPFVHSRSGMPVDIVLAGPGLEELFFQRRRRRTIDGVPVFVASPEDVVVMKTLAGRGKDEDDVVAILAAQPRLNLKQIRATLGVLERALDQNDLAPRFENLLVRARRPSSSRRRRL
ncbi:MAG: DUF6036 family nucleotidyltransferase [Burkholderiales bacterium]